MYPDKSHIIFSGLLLVLAHLALTISSCTTSYPDEISSALASLEGEIDFNSQVQPILSDRCFTCHGPDEGKRKANLRLDQPEHAYSALSKSSEFAIKKGNLAQSQLFHRITATDEEEAMPPLTSELRLTNQEKAILIKWIKQGAPYEQHWAYIPPIKSDPSKYKRANSALHPIDAFIQNRLKQRGWSPAPRASKEDLLRRVSLDITGLPPTIQEMDDFLADTSAAAYGAVVDRLLASPHFGERMAADWLDVARFADTHGYTVDRYRDMSPWRDWVIQAFNKNLPYDQFITWQLAGDLIPQATEEQILATGFNRNHQQNMEGGIIPEEFRVEYVADRTNTLGKAFLGLTTECARCHDHKYDPLTQKEYYQFFSFFNQVNEAGQISFDNAMPGPTILLSDEAIKAKIAFIEQKIEQQKKSNQEAEQTSILQFEHWIDSKRYQTLFQDGYPAGLIGNYHLNHSTIQNRVSPFQKATMRQQHVSSAIPPVLTNGKEGNGLQLDGDSWLDLNGVGAFNRSSTFTIGLWVYIPKELNSGVLFHKGIGAAIYNFRGFHLALKEDKLELLMARTAPSNAIIEVAPDIPRDDWVHLTMTYDGSSSAEGLRLFMNGKEQETQVFNDNLFKDISFGNEVQDEPGVQFGARWRGKGAKDVIIDEIAIFDRTLSELEIIHLANSAQANSILRKSADELSENDKTLLQEYFLNTLKEQQVRQDQLIDLYQEKYSIIDTLQELMVMGELDYPRKSFVLKRGLYDQYGEEVHPETPSFLPPMQARLPKNRLGLVQWMTDPNHPLTSRVFVNRIWQQFFGRGIVDSPDDFGSQGARPTHPELLDWLSNTFIESGWDIKKLIRLIVTTHTYQQSSVARTEIRDSDPQNRLFAQGPSSRMTAEMLRDNALSVSKLLQRSIGGGSVKPFQPEGLWRINGGEYIPDTGPNQFRRSLYTFWKRTVPHPVQSTFDAPDRAICTVKRQETNTPLQALVLLNEPVFIAASQKIGFNILQETNIEKGIINAFRGLTGRLPSAGEVELLVNLQAEKTQLFREFPAKMKGWLPDDNNIELTKKYKPLLAANAVVASTIINADATIIKR